MNLGHPLLKIWFVCAVRHSYGRNCIQGVEKIHLRFLEWIGVKQDHGFASKDLASGSASFGSVRSLEGKMNLEKGERFDRGLRSLSTER